jgi:hypothetical protein
MEILVVEMTEAVFVCIRETLTLVEVASTFSPT